MELDVSYPNIFFFVYSVWTEDSQQGLQGLQGEIYYPDRAATTSDDSIPTDPSPRPFAFRSRAAASALFLNI